MDQAVKTEEMVLAYFFQKIGTPAHIFYEFLNEARKTSQQESLDLILPKMLYLNIVDELKVRNLTEDITFSDFKPHLLRIFERFQVPFNKFTEAVARRVLGNVKFQQDCFWLVEIEKTEEFLQLFFGNSKDYKFYVKVARIFEDAFKRIPNIRYGQNIYIIPTSVRKNFQGRQTIAPSMCYAVSPVGLESNLFTRGDSLVLFGKHPHADIIFPESESFIDQVSIIIYNSGDNYYIVDCCTKSYAGIRLDFSKSLKLNEEQ